MLNKIRNLVFVVLIFVCNYSMSATHFAEFNPMSGDRLVATGTLGSNPFKMLISDETSLLVDFYYTPPVTNNTSSIFNSREFATPQGQLDVLPMGVWGHSSGDPERLTLTFDSTVIDPVFHFSQIGGSSIDFSKTDGYRNLSRLSGDEDFHVEEGRIIDVNGQAQDGGASGSVRLEGQFRQITIYVGKQLNGDGFYLQISENKIEPKAEVNQNSLANR